MADDGSSRRTHWTAVTGGTRRIPMIGALLLPLALLLVACPEEPVVEPETVEEPGVDEPEMEPPEVSDITFLIDFFPSGNHSVFYTTREQGYFEEEGLDVSIEHVLGGAEVIRSIVAGRAQFGYADFASMAVANVNENADLIGVMGVLQQTPMAIHAATAAGIREPSDLPGRTLTNFAGSSTAIVWPVFLDANNLSPEDVDVELVDPGAIVTLVIEERADGFVAFFTDNEPVFRQRCDCDVTVIAWKDHGVETLSNGIIASRQFVEENPATTRALVHALVRGLERTRIDPEGAVDDLMEVMGDDIGVSRDIVLAQTLNWLTLTVSPAGGGDPTGHMTEEDWNATVDLMIEAGQMPRPEVDTVDGFYTNEFLP